MLRLPQGPRRAATAALIALLSSGTLAAAPAFASASVTPASVTAAPKAAPAATPDFNETKCNGDVCEKLIVSEKNGQLKAAVFAGANTNAFHGYFHVSGPGGPFHPANSPTEMWVAHGLVNGDAYVLSGLSPLHGTYCSAGFRNGSSIGKACVTF